MPRWRRVMRGMMGTGLTFAAAVGAVASLVAGIAWLLPGGEGVRELARLVLASSIWAFPIGVAFSGFLALTARGRSFDQLSIPRFAALGAGGGLLLFGALALNAWDAWPISTAVANATLFVLLGGGVATTTLVVARRAAPTLEAPNDLTELGEG